MRLKSISLFGYRGFASKQELRLARPNGNPGSGLTILVGPNNAGKSSILECFHFLKTTNGQPAIREGQKNTKTNGEIRIDYQSEGHAWSIVTGPGGITSWTATPSPQQATTVYVLPSRRTIDPTFPLSPQDRATYLAHSPEHASRRPSGSTFGSRIATIDSSKQSYFTLLGTLLPNPPKWYLAQNDQGNYYMQITSGTSPHTVDGLGSGTTSAIHLADALYDSKPNDFIAIDEPELSLHPAAQRRLAALLISLSTDRQLLLATHSPFFVPLEYLAGGMTIARIHETQSGSTISQLTESTSQHLQSFLADRNNPHTLGLDARESVFLEDNVILVEGQEDVVGYRSLLGGSRTPLPASYFGWGVGGASKMGTIAAFLRELGMKKVYGILDKGMEGLCKDLAGEFLDYRFETTPAVDVRHKRARPAKAESEGLLLANLSPNPAYEPYADELHNRLMSYFSPTAA